MERKISSILVCSILIIGGWPLYSEFMGQSNGEDELTDPIPQNAVGPSSSSGGSGGLADSPWPMFRGNLNHTGLSPYDTSGNNGQLKWYFTTDDWVQSSPAIGTDGTIFVGCYNNKLYAINPDGTEKWNFTTGGYIPSSPAIGSDGTIYVGSYDYKIYAINPDGTEKWSFITGYKIRLSSPAIGFDGTIYVGSDDGKLYAINPDGTEKWISKTSLDYPTSPAIGSDGTIYISSSGGKLYAINQDGTEKWSFKTRADIDSSPAIGFDGTIYFGSADDKLYAINPDGTQKWNFTTNESIHSSPAIGSDGTIYVGSRDDKLYAINPNGTQKWNFTTNGTVDSSPAIGSDGTIYVGSEDDSLYAINPDGTQKWSYTTGGEVGSSPAIGSDGTIYVGSKDNHLYAIGTPSIQNQPPVADAGPDQTVSEGDVVHFDGTGSFAPNGTIDAYEWDFDADFDSDGDGDPRNDVDATGPTPTYVYGDDGVYNVTLTVKSVAGGGTVVKKDLDCVFCMDSSGSMSWNDPTDLRIIEAQNMVANHFELPDRGAVVDFDSDAFLVPEANPNGDHLSSDYVQIINNLWLIDSSGGTDLSNGLNLSNYEMATEADLSTKVPVIICLTDAEDLTSGDHAESRAEANYSARMGVVIFTIGLTIPLNGTSELLLKEIANITGGKYFPAPDPSYFQSIYEEISEIVENLTTEKASDTDTMQVTVNNLPPYYDIGVVAPYPLEEGFSVYFSYAGVDPGSDDLTFSWNWGDGMPDSVTTHYNNGLGPDPYPSPGGIYPFSTLDSKTHVYGDDADYTVTLTITDDDGGIFIKTIMVSVDNIAPFVTEYIIPYTAEEGAESIFRATARDYGSDDLTFEWDFGDSTPILTNYYYNDGSSPDPYPSPGGTYPFIAQDTVNHTYGDDYDYPLTLTITDDDGGVTTFTTTVIVENVNPQIEPFGPFTIDEGSQIDITGIGTDPGSDDLTFTWEFEGGPTITNTYFNDGTGADPYPSPEGTYPFSALDMVDHTYGDDGNYSIILTLTDDDGGSMTYETYVLVNNVPPSITSFNYTVLMVNEPRTIGYWGHQCEVDEPYGDHTGILQEWVDKISSQSQVFSWISSEDDICGIVQEGDASDMIVMAERQLMGVWLNMVSGKLHPVTEVYMPNLTASTNLWEAILEIEDVILNSENRTELERVKDIADNINNGIGIAWGIVEFTATATDPGADDLTFHWDFGDGKSQDSYYPNPGGVFPISATDHVEHSYFSQGTFTVTLTVTDDDGGIASASHVIIL